MKNNKFLYIYVFLLLLVSSVFNAQTKGIAYQAVIFKPEAKSIPGVSLPTSPLLNTTICLRFTFLDSVDNKEYQETITATTDNYGIVNTVIGLGNQSGGYAANFNAISWNTNQKKLVVELDTTASCSSFEEISNQLLATAPFSFSAITANNITGIAAIANGGTGADNASDARGNLGLGNVNNTSDINKPISTATQLALNLKEDVLNKSTDVAADAASDIKYPTVKALKTYVDSHNASGGIADGAITDIKIANGINPSKVGLGNVDNTSDLNKPISTATQTVLNLKEDAANKSTSITLGTSDVLFPTQNAVKSYVDAQMVSAGVADGSITTIKLADASVTNAKLAEVITVPHGGTGAASLTGYIIGNGTNAMTSTSTIPVTDVAGAVRKVNGNLPNAAGEVVLSFGKVYTGSISNRNTVIASPVNGDIYVVSGDLTPSNNGLTYIYDGTNWNEITANQSSLDARYLALAGGTMQGDITVPAGKKIILTDAPTNTTDVVNKEYVDSTVLSGAPDATSTEKGKVQLAGDLAGSGSSAAAPIVGRIQGVPVATTTPTTGQILYFDGTSWVPTSAPVEEDGIIGNEVTDVVTDGGLTRSGTGTTADPYKLKINDGTANGQILVWDGAKWVAQAAPAEVDAIIGNEVTDAVANGGLTRSGTGTALDPYKLKINDGTVNGQLLTWDGTKWVAQAATPDWALAGNAGTNPSTDFLGTTDAQDLALRTNNTEKVRVTSTGNVGIGTTIPTSKLHVNGNIALTPSGAPGSTKALIALDTQSRLRLTGGTNDNYDDSTGASVDLHGNAAGGELHLVGGQQAAGTSAAIKIFTNANVNAAASTQIEAMTILGNGNVGMGNNTPTSHLTLNGPIATPIIETVSNVTLDNTHAVVKINANSNDVNINLPDPTTVNGRTYIIIKTDKSINKLVFNETIIGNEFSFNQANVPGTYQIQSDGTAWNLIK